MVLLRVPTLFALLGLASGVVEAAQVPLGIPSFAQATHTRTAITPKFSALISRYLADSGVPALSVGVVYVNGSTVKTEFGTWGNRTEEGDATSKETLFYIGSCSKAFLSASIGILMDDFAQGKNVTALPAGLEEFTWTTKLQDILPGEWKLQDQWASEKANIHDILSHVSGLPRHDLAYGSHDTPADIVHRLRLLKPIYELREHYYYNNHMYVVGAHIVSKYSGMSFNAYVNERILKPLNMTSTVHQAREIPSHGLLAQAFTENRRRIPAWFAGDDVATLLAGAGGIITNTVDMTKWLAMLINNGVNPYTNAVVVPKDVIQAVTTAYSVESGQGPDRDTSIGGYGMGWSRSAYKGHEVVEHGGGLPGFLTETRFLPRDGFGVSLMMSNDFAGSVPATVMRRITDEVLGLAHSEHANLDTRSPPANAVSTPVASEVSLPAGGQSFATGPTLALSAYEGLYTHPAYGPLVLCTSTNTSSYCSNLITEFSSVNATSKPALYASWDRVWTKHLQLFPLSGNEFELASFTIFPHGFGKDERPFKATLMRENVRVVFDVEEGAVKGLALPNGFEPRPVPAQKEPLKDSALVYYDKV